MPYRFHTTEDRQAMLATIGEPSLQQLIDQQVPENCRLNRPLDLPSALTEIELERHLRELASLNDSPSTHLCFLGGGAYDHFVPAVVDALASRGEFYTSYTPYQPEVSQGNLQVMFEYESLICQLTGLDVSNASLYDGGTAAVEAVLMALAATNRRKVIAAGAVHPEYRQIIRTYLKALEMEFVETSVQPDGTSNDILAAIDDQTACVLIQHPNFFGRLEDVTAISSAAHQKGALVAQVFDPISLGLLKRPCELGADIAIAEGQCLGNHLAYGGPYLGIMACKQDLVRRLPGRIAGQTVDRNGNRCWVLTLQTREQHIRREKATSNICTNQGLLALRATMFLSLLGPQGLRQTAEHCAAKTAFARQSLQSHDRFEIVHPGPVFKEFVVRDRADEVEGLMEYARRHGVLAGTPLQPYAPELHDCFLVAVTEQRTRKEIERWAEVLTEAPVRHATATGIPA